MKLLVIALTLLFSTPLLGMNGHKSKSEITEAEPKKTGAGKSSDPTGQCPPCDRQTLALSLRDDETMLMLATREGDSAFVEQLLAKNSKVINVQNNDGQTALMIATRWVYPDIVRILLKAKADPSMSSGNKGKGTGTESIVLKEAQTALSIAQCWYEYHIIVGSDPAKPDYAYHADSIKKLEQIKTLLKDKSKV